MIEISVTTDGLDESMRALKAFDDIAQDELTKAMYRTTAAIENRAQANAPVDRGRLRGSLGSKIKTLEPTVIRGVVGSSLKDEVYPVVMEEGREPGTLPPISAIQAWVRRKFRPRAQDERSIAWAVATKIKKYGIEGRKYMERAADASVQRIYEHFERAVAAIAERLTRD